METTDKATTGQVMELLKHFGEFAFQNNFHILFSLNERNDWVAKFVNAEGKSLSFENKIMEFRDKAADVAVAGLAKQALAIINVENLAKQEILNKGKSLNLVS
jgi:hypothetical protein